MTKAIGFLSDEGDADYEDVTGNYKAEEGSMGERVAVMNAARAAGSSARLRFTGAKNNDVHMQMIDLDKGDYGKPYKVSIFLHVRTHTYLLCN